MEWSHKEIIIDDLLLIPGFSAAAAVLLFYLSVLLSFGIGTACDN